LNRKTVTVRIQTTIRYSSTEAYVGTSSSVVRIKGQRMICFSLKEQTVKNQEVITFLVIYSKEVKEIRSR
jgi:hypothetical protein